MDRKERTEELLAKLKEGVEALQSSEDWMELLRFQSRMHSYSFNNVILIRLQCPEATHVAGFRKWKTMGRSVRKGEKAIKILAPLIVKKEDKDSPDPEAKKKVLIGFREVSVFDISQTDGEPLPSKDQFYQLLDGDEARAEALFLRLRQYSEDVLAIPVHLEPIHGRAHGYLTVTPPNRIVIEETNPPMHRTKTLVHELGHAILHLAEPDVHARPEMEVEAESVAFVVLEHLGIESAQYSFSYVTGWSGGDAELVSKSGARIQRAAHQLLDFVMKEAEVPAEETEAA